MYEHLLVEDTRTDETMDKGGNEKTMYEHLQVEDRRTDETWIKEAMRRPCMSIYK